MPITNIDLGGYPLLWRTRQRGLALDRAQSASVVSR